jgi:DNA modification methylase
MYPIDDKLTEMNLVSRENFEEFIEKNREVVIENKKLKIGNDWSKIKNFGPPLSYEPETKTIWSFYDRGDWCTHKGNYRGNWSPYIPRNLILRYSSPRDLILDQMVGSGTTLVECKLLGRAGIGVDINPDSIMVAQDRLNFSSPSSDIPLLDIRTYVGDARKLDRISDNSIDLIITHPPYSSIVKYSKLGIEGDLSHLKLPEYIQSMKDVARESYRVLKHNSHCAILIGDTRKHLHFIPISTRILLVFLEAGFILREDIIKQQHKTTTELGIWRGKKYPFFKIAHEHLFIFRKPKNDEKLSIFKNSMNWLELSQS